MATSEHEAAESLVTTKRAIKDLFQTADIKRVVVVDDEWAGSIEIESVLGAIVARQASGVALGLADVSELAGFNFDDPREIWEPALKRAWDSFNNEQKKGIGRQLEIEKEDHAAGAALTELFDGASVSFLSHKEWEATGGGLISSSSTAPTLFLFDQDMRKDGGAVDQGMRTIATLLLSGTVPEGFVYLALFSNTIEKNVEYTQWLKLAEDHSILEHKERFAVMSKKHLNDDSQLIAARLKRVIISPICASLKTRLFESVQAASSVAQEKVKELNIYDFEQIVFRSSFEEGVWEPDTLLRLYGLYHRAEARKLAQANASIHDLANKVRSVITVDYEPDDRPESRATELQRLELYEEAQYLLDHRLPIEAGDIFEKTNGGSKWVLVAQPCSIAVRGDEGGKNRPDSVTLAQIKMKGKDDKLGDSFVELPFYSRDISQKACVYLGHYEQVATCVLDLCVFSSTGESVIEVGAQCPDGVIPAWKKRYEELQAMSSSLLGKYKDLTGGLEGPKLGQVLKVLASSLTQPFGPMAKGEIKLSPDKIVYPLKRIGRLKQPRAGSLLRDFADYSSRDAFDHDLTRKLKGQASRPGA